MSAADIRLWHSMNGARGADFERIVARFNASQKEFRVVPTFKGQYDEAAVEAVTARRTSRAPHIVQASELGGAYLGISHGTSVTWPACGQPRKRLTT